ncbi:MAG TPA: glycoside hydrolase family 27 protein [Solirubrobacteraceae bacterium]|nr:glycoside hydrolase family 27 protein [Solirubrobacteraceae bacterium]
MAGTAHSARRRVALWLGGPTAVALALPWLVALALAPSADATPALDWSSPAPADSAGHPTGVSCPSTSLCVGVDDAGNVLTTGDPTAPAPAWTPAPADPGQALVAVSCASTSLCVAVDRKGSLLVSTAPTAGAPAWTSKPADSGHELTGVSCPSEALCVAVDGSGNVLVSTEPTRGLWRVLSGVDGSGALSGVSCSSASLCAAVDRAGGLLTSREPAGLAGSWHRRALDAVPNLSGVSCGSGGACVAVDSGGDALASGNPSAAAPTWSESEIDPGNALSAVSCAPLGQCVAVDGGGHALAGEAPTLTPAAWSVANPDAGALAAVSCAEGSFCLALDRAGNSIGALLPPPASLVAPPPTPRPSIQGTTSYGSQLLCAAGIPSDPNLQLSYVWLRELEPIAGATASGYTVKTADEGHHLQCRVTASDAAGSATATSSFVTVPFQGLPVASGETRIGRARAHGKRVVVPVVCSPRATHGCRLVLRLVRPGGGRSATIAERRVRVGRGSRRTVSLVPGPAGRRLLARRHRLAVTLLVSGTVIGSIEAPLAEQRLTLGAVGSRAVAAGSASESESPLGDVAAASASARAGGVSAAKPYMGWDSYFAFGPRYSESTVLEQASDLISLGLARHGYRFVWLDVGWWQGQRGAKGQIALDRAQWPHGFAWLAGVLHRAGLLFGLYTDAGANGCGGLGQGSYGHYGQDAATFAAWGVDAVKVDFCGGSQLGLDPARAYGEFRAALNATHRSMLLSICDFLQPGEHADGTPGVAQSAFSSYTFGPTFGNSWRTDGDVGVPGRVPFGNVLRNLDADAAHPQAAGPGHWNDPDYLGPDQGMGVQQFRTQMSMWSMLAAPLMASRDLARLSRASLATLSNREVVAIDQDPLGAQGTLVSGQGAGEVWVKPLSDGSRAVALLNRGAQALSIQTSATAVGLGAARRYLLHDLWRDRTSSTAGPIGAQVGGYSTVLLRVSAAG